MVPEDSGNRMQRCAFLTLEDPTGYHIDDDRAIPVFADRGWTVDVIPWSRPDVDWARFDAVIVRSTWDYQKSSDRFFGVLEAIAGAGIPLFNDLDLMRWNADKRYLADLAERGIAVVPTLFGKRFETGDERLFADVLESDSLVIKPVIGANAERTWRLDSPEDRMAAAGSFAADAFMVQVFVRSVLEEGEVSLFYFDGEYSHAIRKQPRAGDFRVQEEHGGHITAYRPSVDMLEAAGQVLDVVDGSPLYARVDMVLSNDDPEWWLMELELIEPSMYLRMDPDAADRFADAFVRRMDRT